MSATTLFGAPLGYTATTLADWIRALERCWSSFTHGVSPSGLNADLEQLRDVYGHGATAKKLRETVAKLTSESDSSFELPADVAITVDGLWLITPEGRVLLDVLYHLRRTGEYVVDTEAQNRALSAAVQVRSDWYGGWALKQLSGTLSPAPIGAAILILVNGSADLSTAFLLPDDEKSRPELGPTVLEMIGDFSQALGGSRPGFSPLRNHWAFTQATRILSQDIERTAGEKGARIYVREGREQHLLRNLRERLGKYRPGQARDAVTGLTESYRKNRGLFASLGIMNERPVHTHHVVDALLGDGPI